MALPIRSEYSIAGNGPAVFLTHGVGARRQVWDAIVEKLAPHFRCITYDLRGHGGSAGADQPFGIEEFVADLEALRMQLGIEHAHFVGHSLGGMIVPAYARAHPERVESLGLISTAAFRNAEARASLAGFVRKIDAEGTAGVVDTLLDRWFTDQFRRDRPDVVEARKKYVLNLDPRVYRETYNVFATTETGPWLSGIDAPTLVMTGELDPGCGPALNEKMAAALPHSELVILPALKHSILVEAPGSVIEVLLRFLLASERSYQ
ncbi:MAG: alpha/beta fold hydrolase [Rhizobiales bacterium]|nr:alpha/beta fold hydrolase [Hyphomicrobiales bacterium]